MKTYQYDEPDENGQNRTVTMTEEEILAQYWDYWQERMQAVEQPVERITRERCIQDWVSLHFASEVKE